MKVKMKVNIENKSENESEYCKIFADRRSDLIKLFTLVIMIWE